MVGILVLLILVIHYKKLIVTQKLVKLKIKLLLIMINITPQEFNKLTSETLTAR